MSVGNTAKYAVEERNSDQVLLEEVHWVFIQVESSHSCSIPAETVKANDERMVAMFQAKIFNAAAVAPVIPQ